MSARRAGAAVGLVCAIGLGPTASATTTPQPADLGSPELSQEAALGAFQDLAVTRGAIGFYRDEKTDDLVIVVPLGAARSRYQRRLPASMLASRKRASMLAASKMP